MAVRTGRGVRCADLDQIERFLLHEVDEKEHRQLAAHLERCARCQALAADVAANLRQMAPLRALVGGDQLARGDSDVGPRLTEFLIEGYRLIREIGRGGMGVVFVAQQESPSRQVALKLPRPERLSSDVRRRFAFEVEALGRLQHPGIARIYEAGIADTAFGPQPFLAMELVAGRPLAGYCRVEQPSLNERLQLIVQICDAVQHAHQRGIIHRDIKPGNVFVDESGQVKILDFGIARAVESDSPLTTLQTDVGQLIGTLPYMSPEQITGDPRELDTRTDVYSIGVLAYELVSGSRPFPVDRKSLAEAARIIDQTPAIPLGSIDGRCRGDLERIIAKAMEKDRERRYQSAAEFGADIRCFLGGLPPSVAPESATAHLRRFVRRYKLPLAAACAIVLAVTIGFAVSASMYFLAERRLQQVIRLSDLHDLRILRDELRRVPAVPANIPLFESWLTRARGLTRRLPLHRATLAELRQRAEPYTERDRGRNMRDHPQAARLDDLKRSRTAYRRQLNTALAENPAAERREDIVRLQEKLVSIDSEIARIETLIRAERTWTFTDATLQWQHHMLEELIKELDELAKADGGFATIPYVKKQLDFSRHVRESSIDGQRDAWERAIRSIRNRESCPMYQGLNLTPQLGLLPIGRDPESGLWEFAHLQTGTAPKRRPDGKLILTEDTGIVLVLIPGGSFAMGAVPPSPERPTGSPNVDPLAYVYDHPLTAVKLAPFFMSKFEMTQGQWLRAEDNNPSTWGSQWKQGEENFNLLHPVETVTWHEADRVLARLRLALPTEAQWEYATRAGTTTPFWTGQDKHSIAGAANIADRRYGARRPNWHVTEEWLDDGYHRHAPVGSFQANHFGLHDVMGNVSEWCYDGCGPRTIPVRPGDGLRIASEGGGGLRITRSGSFHTPSDHCRSVAGLAFAPTYRAEDIGVRPARSIAR